VTPVNDPPSFVNPVREASANEGGRIQFTLSATDLDLALEGDHLSLSLLEEDGVAARGASFRDNGDNSGSFDWTTGFEDAGVYRPVFRVEDREGLHAEVEVTITVTNVNRLPVIQSAVGSRRLFAKHQ